MAQLSTEPAIEELHKEWNKINRKKLSLYYENKDPTVPLVDNKEFRSIKNMIINAVLEMPADPEPTLSAKEISMLDHFSAGFTLDTYTHVTTSAQKEAAQTMGNVLSM